MTERLLELPDGTPTNAEFEAEAAALDVEASTVVRHYREALRTRLRGLPPPPLSGPALTAGSGVEAAAAAGLAPWRLAPSLERTPGRAPLALLRAEFNRRTATPSTSHISAAQPRTRRFPNAQ